MKVRTNACFWFAIMILSLSSACSAVRQNENELVRIAEIEVDSIHRDSYTDYLREEIAASILREPGVITIFGVADKEDPGHVTLFETYADSAHYRSHLTTTHFQKYKQGTLHMVKRLDLIPAQPLLYHRKPALSKARPEDLYVRLIKIELDSNAIGNFNELGNTIMLPGIREEPGILVMYAVAEKDNPTRVSILEVYQNAAAYDKHIETPHYLEYKKESKAIVKSLQLIDVDPVLLGAKPQ